MVIEHFRGGDPAPVYRRFRERGRLAPEGLRYVASWVDADLRRCWQVMEAETRAQLEQWMAAWADLVEFEVRDALTSAQASERVLGPVPALPNPASPPPARAGAPTVVPPRIRRATDDDADVIARHRVALFETVLPDERRAEAMALLAPSRDAVRAMLAAGTSLAWVADEGEPSGSLVMHLVDRLPSPSSPTGREGYIVHVFVREGRRDSGLGAALLAAAESEARARGLSRIRLHAVARALPFYARAGYKPRANDLELLLY